MKVLSKGREQTGWSREAECTGAGNGGGGCGAKLLVEQDDVFRTVSTALHERTEHNTFRCASCSVWTDLDRVPFTPRSRDESRDGARSGTNLIVGVGLALGEIERREKVLATIRAVWLNVMVEAMVKILKRGDAHIVASTGTVTCDRCKSELRVARADFTSSPDPRDPEPLLSCPVCTAYIGSKSVMWGTR